MSKKTPKNEFETMSLSSFYLHTFYKNFKMQACSKHTQKSCCDMQQRSHYDLFVKLKMKKMSF